MRVEVAFLLLSLLTATLPSSHAIPIIPVEVQATVYQAASGVCVGEANVTVGPLPAGTPFNVTYHVDETCQLIVDSVVPLNYDTGQEAPTIGPNVSEVLEPGTFVSSTTQARAWEGWAQLFEDSPCCVGDSTSRLTVQYQTSGGTATMNSAREKCTAGGSWTLTGCSIGVLTTQGDPMVVTGRTAIKLDSRYAHNLDATYNGYASNSYKVQCKHGTDVPSGTSWSCTGGQTPK
ncbi:MAG TPA: hypothetical protein VM370_04080 [Candidatus Thermoplasmatota archaeon]|nr:hypothetical protein [Candidatus Thermoplasmatota archaeon]